MCRLWCYHHRCGHYNPAPFIESFCSHTHEYRRVCPNIHCTITQAVVEFPCGICLRNRQLHQNNAPFSTPPLSTAPSPDDHVLPFPNNEVRQLLQEALQLPRYHYRRG